MSELWNNYGKPGLKLAARTGVHAAAAPFDLAVAGSEALSGAAKRFGVPLAPSPVLLDNNGQPLTGPGVPARPLPSQELINAGVQIDPNAGVPMKVADFVLPFLVSGSRGAAGRVAEAPGVINKTAEGLGYVTGAGIDAGLSYLGGVAGDKYIGGPEGAFVGSLFGGGVRPLVQRGFGFGSQKTVADPNAPLIFDAMTNAGPNTMPTFGQVSGPSGKQFEKAVGSVPILRSGVNAARENAETGIQQSVATGVGEVGDRQPNLAPVSSDTTAGRIIDLSREANTSQQAQLSEQQQALEDAIGADRPTNVSPLVDTLSSLANQGPAPITRVVNPRVADLYSSLNPGATDASELTAPYGHLKVLRTDLGDKTVTTDPIKGPAYDTAYGGYTDAMRGAAQEAGQGPQFDQANLDYSTFKQVNQPWLERQGGSVEPGAQPANPTTVASRANAITGAGSGYLGDIRAQLGLDPARATLADVLSRLGQIKGAFTPSRWGSDYANVSPAVKQFIAQHAPTATPYLENAATGGRAFDLQPERPGLSNSLGFLGGLGEFLAKSPALAVAGAGGLETPSVIRALAGRTDIPALLAQYAQRQGVAAGSRGP
jgi:hypothetical protein